MGVTELVDFDTAARMRIDVSMDMLGSTLQASETRRILGIRPQMRVPLHSADSTSL